MAGEYSRWDPDTKIMSLRFSNVILPEDYANFETWQNDPKVRKWKCVMFINKKRSPLIEVVLLISAYGDISTLVMYGY